MLHFDQKNIYASSNQSYYGLMLRVREEVSKRFIDFFIKSPSSLYKNVRAVISRRGYQSNYGNLENAHIILAVDLEKLSEVESVFFTWKSLCI